MTGRPAEIVVVGNLHLDILVSAPDRPRRGETVLGTAWQEKCGGKGGNQAVEAARHGAGVAMIGTVGDDAFGRRLVGNLAAHGVATDLVRVVPGASSGMSVAILDAEGDYGAVVVPAANWLLRDEYIAAAGHRLGGAAIVVLQNEATAPVNRAAAAWARAGGARVVFNAAPARAVPSDLLARVDLLVVNAVEAEMMGGGAVETLADAEQAAATLLAVAPAVIVTAGPAGLVAAERGVTPTRIAAHPVAAVSSHGAGDAFIGALAARLAAGDALLAAARYANAAAAVLVSTPESGRQALGADRTRRLLDGKTFPD